MNAVDCVCALFYFDEAQNTHINACINYCIPRVLDQREFTLGGKVYNFNGKIGIHVS